MTGNDSTLRADIVELVELEGNDEGVVDHDECEDPVELDVGGDDPLELVEILEHVELDGVEGDEAVDVEICLHSKVISYHLAAQSANAQFVKRLPAKMTEKNPTHVDVVEFVELEGIDEGGVDEHDEFVKGHVELVVEVEIVDVEIVEIAEVVQLDELTEIVDLVEHDDHVDELA